jgi:peptidoglycan hydrolase-like protein with peptidoglycan-binding domain
LGGWYGGGWYDPYNWWDYPYGVGDSYGYYDAPDTYSDNQSSYDDTASANGTVAAAQKALTKLGYYHGSIDGVAGPETETAVRQFQSVDNLPVTGELDNQTLQALQVG